MARRTTHALIEPLESRPRPRITCSKCRTELGHLIQQRPGEGVVVLVHGYRQRKDGDWAQTRHSTERIRWTQRVGADHPSARPPGNRRPRKLQTGELVSETFSPIKFPARVRCLDPTCGRWNVIDLAKIGVTPYRPGGVDVKAPIRVRGVKQSGPGVAD